MPILNSILDNDLYKLTMQKAVLAYRQGVPTRSIFNNRRPEGMFNDRFFEALTEEIDAMRHLHLTPEEGQWLEEQCPFLGKDHIAYLRDYEYNPAEINCRLADNELQLSFEGPWERVILWEVPLMAIISELYFRHCDTSWSYDKDSYAALQIGKARVLDECFWADFGTRRRRSYAHQDLVVDVSARKPGFVGTSNVHLAMKHGVKPIGTMAHEWIMGISALEGLRYANRHALTIWSDVFRGNLGVALTDTFGTESFFGDFDLYLAKLFDGVRHDSGDPNVFGHRVIAHYEKLGIDPTTKTIVFSDGLNASDAAKLQDRFDGKIRTSFGIGTHFTNDYLNSKALNMVIKMSMCNHIPVVKLSDVLGKQIGDPDALRVANWTFNNKGLDAA